MREFEWPAVYAVKLTKEEVLALGFKLPAHPVSEKFVKYFAHWSHDLPVTPVLHWHCPMLSFIHTEPLIAPAELQLHPENSRTVFVKTVALLVLFFSTLLFKQIVVESSVNSISFY